MGETIHHRLERARAEIARLTEAKRHFSALADAKGKENVALRAEVEQLRADLKENREDRGENERLWAALTEIANYHDDEPGTWMRMKAERALEQRVEGGTR